MDQNSIDGAARQTAGQMRETVGKVTGDSKMQMQGKIDQAAGSLQQSYGGLLADLDAFTARLRERTREQPITAVLAAAAIGYLIGRVGRWI